ncbi:MAG: OmpA family protein [Saprospiraceae bacterium]
MKDDNLKANALSILRSRRNTEGQLMAPEPFAKELTSLYNEGPVCFDRTAETVFFSRNILVKGKQKVAKDGLQKMRLYQAKKTGDAWTDPVALPFNNNEFDDCHPAISIDGDKLYFSSNRPGGMGGMDLYVSYKVGESWSEPVNLGPEINSSGNEVFPFIHADNTLYYASDGHPGSGGLDLFYAVMTDDGWTKPVNMGEPFNSGKDDFGLIVDLNKINGYFSSNGRGGAGGDEIHNLHVNNGNLDDFLLQNQRVPDRDLDLMVQVREMESKVPVDAAKVRILNLERNNVIGRDEDGNLITIVNVDGQEVMKSLPPDEGIEGTTTNSGEYSTTVKPGNYVIIVSKRGFQTKQVQLQIGQPGNKIEVELERATGKVTWLVSVFNSATNSPLAGGTLVLTDERTGMKDTVILDGEGNLEYYLDPETDYTIDILQADRNVGNSAVNTRGYVPGDTINQNITVSPLLPGSTIELPNIYYNFNDATLRPDARKDLNLVVALLNQHPTITIELASHTDSRGTHTYNQDLSQRRANGVVEYLVQNGIAADRLKPVGYGETQLRNGCSDGVSCTDKEHARNRRTELRVLTGAEGANLTVSTGDDNPNSDSPEPDHINEPSAGDASVRPAVSSSGSMEYFVIAGSFLRELNAQNQLRNIQELGYTDAEIVQFEGAEFFSVCVAKKASRADAAAFKKELKSTHGVDSFVRAVAPPQ